jgi:glycosyltransferase involved in cell wall biosynthesis
MRLLLLTANYLPYPEYGAEKAVRMLATALVEAGHHDRVVTTCPVGEERCDMIDNHEVEYVAQNNWYWSGDREQKPTAAKVAWHIRDTRNPVMGTAVGKIYDQWRPDIVHTHILAGFSVDVWLAAAARRLPIVPTLHDRYLFCPTSTMFAGERACQSHCLACRPFSLPRRWASAVVDGLTSPSQATLDVHTAGHFFGNARCKAVVPNFIGNALATMHASNTSGRVIGFIGRLSVEKGLRVLLQHVRSIPPAAIHRLVIAGSGPLETEVRSAAHQDPRIIFNGYQKPADFFAQIDALVVPSICHDTSPNVIREAFAHGIPIVGSTFGGIPELVRLVDERLVFKPDDPESLARAIDTALDHSLRPELQSRALAAGAAFSTERIMTAMTNVYQQVRDSSATCLPTSL